MILGLLKGLGDHESADSRRLSTWVRRKTVNKALSRAKNLQWKGQIDGVINKYAPRQNHINGQKQRKCGSM